MRLTALLLLATFLISAPAVAAEPGGYGSGYGSSPPPGRTRGPSPTPSPSATPPQQLPLTGTSVSGLFLIGLGVLATGAGLLWRTRTVHKGR